MQWSVTVYTTCPQAVFKSRVSHLCIYTRHWNTVISSNRKLIVKKKTKFDLFYTQDQWFPRTQTWKNSVILHSTQFRFLFYYAIIVSRVQTRYDLIWIVKKYIVHFITHDVITKIIIGTIIDNSSNGRKNQTS